jgi:hypothetical protein
MKRRHRLTAFLLMGLLGGQLPGPAWATGFAPSDPTSGQAVSQTTSFWRLAQADQPTLAEAERLYEEATQLFQSGRYEDALSRVEAALQASEHRARPAQRSNPLHTINR